MQDVLKPATLHDFRSFDHKWPPMFFLEVFGSEFQEATHSSVVGDVDPVQVAVFQAYTCMNVGDFIGTILHQVFVVARIRLDVDTLPIQCFVEDVGIAELDTIQAAHFDVGTIADVVEPCQKVLVFLPLGLVKLWRHRSLACDCLRLARRRLRNCDCTCFCRNVNRGGIHCCHQPGFGDAVCEVHGLELDDEQRSEQTDRQEHDPVLCWFCRGPR
mmetsp:Transcript_22377/g.62422  ORF Transcript_22377/g.62422 Transcript_22377/m.62422 type:complete len:215 (-) Transcript_22377:215-859(-)